MVALAAPFPEPTPPPTLPPRSKRKRQSRAIPGTSSAESSLTRRQVIADLDQVALAQQQCQFNSGNNVISCFPSSDSTFSQHEWATFVWNSRRPELTQTNLVNIYLFYADSLKQALFFPNQINPSDQAGVLRTQVNDSWWGDRGNNFSGVNVSYPFYWLITRSDVPLDGSEIPQPIFHAVQTALPDSVVSSMASSSSASAASASAASASSASRSKATSSSGVPGNGGGGVQSAARDASFPHWAIAVIVVLGFLALAATCTLIFLIMRRLRRTRADSSNRNSIGSASPMIEREAGQGIGESPFLGVTGGVPGASAATAATAAAGVHASVNPPARHPSSSIGGHPPPSVADGASTLSRANSAVVGDAGPFSGADAAIMADAFRKALRKPDFAGRPVEEGDSPDHSEERKDGLLSRELLEEGRDLRSVGSSRGVRVETLGDGDGDGGGGGGGGGGEMGERERPPSSSPFFLANPQ